MAVQKTKRQLAEEKKIERMEVIYQDFLNKIKRIEKVRDEKIAAIIKESEERQIKEAKQKLRQF